MYSQELPEIKKYYDWEKYGRDNSVNDMYITQLYGLANRIIAPRLTKFVLEIASNYFRLLSAEHDVVIWAFANLPEDDIFLKMIVDTWCGSSRDLPIESESRGLPREFLRRVINTYSKMCQA
jgi:hypothetical protein